MRRIVSQWLKSSGQRDAAGPDSELAAKIQAILEEYERTRVDWRSIRCLLPGGERVRISTLCRRARSAFRQTAGEAGE